MNDLQDNNMIRNLNTLNGFCYHCTISPICENVKLILQNVWQICDYRFFLSHDRFNYLQTTVHNVRDDRLRRGKMFYFFFFFLLNQNCINSSCQEKVSMVIETKLKCCTTRKMYMALHILVCFFHQVGSRVELGRSISQWLTYALLPDL